jgi:hypothetical protein
MEIINYIMELPEGSREVFGFCVVTAWFLTAYNIDVEEKS